MPPAARASAAATPTTNVAFPAGLFVVRNSEDMEHLVEGTSAFFLSLSGAFGMAAAQLAEKLEYQLQKEGLGREGRLAAFLGTDAAGAARNITDPLFKVADAQAECAALAMVAGREWARNFSEPVKRARAARDQEDLLDA